MKITPSHFPVKGDRITWRKVQETKSRTTDDKTGKINRKLRRERILDTIIRLIDFF